MRAGGENGKHIEELILGYPSNPGNLIDDARWNDAQELRSDKPCVLNVMVFVTVK